MQTAKQARVLAFLASLCAFQGLQIKAQPSNSTLSPHLPRLPFPVPYDVSLLHNKSERLLLQAAYRQFGEGLNSSWGGVHNICFSPDGTRLFFVTYRPIYSQSHLWIEQQNGFINRFVAAQPAIAGSFHAFSPDNTLFAMGRGGDTGDPFNDSIDLWSTKTWQRIAVLKGHHNSVVSLAFSTDSQQLVSGDTGGRVNVYNVASYQLQRTWAPTFPRNQYGYTGVSACVAFQRDGEKQRPIATFGYREPSKPPYDDGFAIPRQPSGQEPTPEVWDVNTGERLQKIESISYPGTASFSPDGSILAVVVYEHDMLSVKVIDWHQGNVFGSYNVHPVENLFFSADGSDIITLGGRGDAVVDVANVVRLRQHLPT